MSTDWTASRVSHIKLGRALAHAIPEAQQLLLMPLWDPLHERVVALMVGFATSWSRCYTRINDLVPMSVFCKSIVAQAGRFESQHMDQRKTDFMSSVSHEMRSPLHGVLANVELLLTTTKCSAEQMDMLQSAAASGRQLLDSIDKVLQYCHISTRDEESEDIVPDQERTTMSIPMDQGESGSRRLGESPGSTSPDMLDTTKTSKQSGSDHSARASQERFRQIPVVLDIAQTVFISQQARWGWRNDTLVKTVEWAGQ
ncbi:hypothetical protein LTR86_001024 [Recurvomyces mirabilis]|nr:hypothetical protein LTR86_001024 [Recurvomyces mirabilis]